MLCAVKKPACHPMSGILSFYPLTNVYIMKNFTRIFSFLLMLLVALTGQSVSGQSILNPADTLVTYNPAKPPAIPAYGSPAKWVRTVRLPWNTTQYKAYIYNGCQFRLCFPLSYNPTANDGKKYPMMIFDHGEGEGGTVYDNEYQMYHGGQIFAEAVAAGTYDGYILCMQTTGGWGTQQWAAQRAIIDYMIANNKLDPFRVTGNGLSGGGAGTWGFFTTNATYDAGIIPMSSDAIQLAATDTVNLAKYTPIWNIHGGLDGSPAPATAAQVLAAFSAAGANYTDLDMTTQGHDTWDSTWTMKGFWPFLLNAYCSNPWTLFGQTQFCAGVPINLTIGLAPGFEAYQWEMNGTLMSQTSNSIHVTQYGTYSARVERNGNWSDWSHVPVVVGVLPPTVSPVPTLAPNSSIAVPDINGNGTTLQEPTTYTSYVWEKVGSNTSIGTNNTVYVTTPGQYIAEVTQLHGCSTSFSQPFTVVNANGPNPPSPASDLIATTLSSTSIILNWSQNPNPVNNNTGFEVWQGSKSGGPYTLIGITAQDASSDTIKNLQIGATYYYKVRAIDATAASAGSNEASATTTADTQPPTAPGSLAITATTGSSISLSWTASKDNVAVTGYDIYINGAKAYATTSTKFTVDALVYPQSYTFVVKAFDAAGNLSPASDQVTGEALQTTVPYQYYTFTTAPASLPNFNTLPVVSFGTSSAITLPRFSQTTLYGVLWQGYITIPTTGVYTFRTTSVDGSALYLGALNGVGSPYNYGGATIVNNDGTHKSAAVTSAPITLTAGVYPIAVAYFIGTNANGAGAITVAWETPTAKTTFVTIPSSAFVEATVVNGRVPVAPSSLVATAQSFNKIGLTWTDTSTVATGFEIWRSTSATTGFAIVNSIGSGVTAFTDSTVAAKTKYYYEVRAIGLYGQSAYSAVSNAATTQSLPAAPSVPYNLVFTPSSSTANLSWTDSTALVTGYNLYRSNNNDQNYVMIASLTGGTTSYTDANLFSNAVYYYKLTATNPGGVSAYTAEVKVTTLDNLPVITMLGNQSARYGTTTTVSLSATSVNSGALAFTGGNLPSFATLTDNGNRTATLTFSPAAAQAGTYTGLYVLVTDIYGGTDTTTFNLSVNNNYAPVIDSIANHTLNEGDTLSIPLIATDQNPSDVLSFTATNLPAGSTLTPVSNGVATLFLHPSYAAAGVYTVQATANDNNGTSTVRTFVVTVNYKNPNQKIFTRVSNSDASALGLPWNPLQGTTTNNLLDSAGNATTVGLSFSPSTWWNTSNDGSPTGNNSGVYPDVVLKDYMWFGAYYGGPNTISGTVTGLDTTQTYTLTFFSSSSYNGVANNGTTTYTVGSQTVSLAVQNNQQNTVSIRPAAAAMARAKIKATRRGSKANR